MHIHMGACPGNIVKQINKSQSNLCIMPLFGGFPGGISGKEATYQGRRHKRCRFDPRVRKIPWRRAWQHTPVFLPGESHGQRSQAGFCLWGHKELDTTERLFPVSLRGSHNHVAISASVSPSVKWDS